MFTRAECIAKAEDAERLASVVSLANDKIRLRREAASWRERAEHVDAWLWDMGRGGSFRRDA